MDKQLVIYVGDEAGDGSRYVTVDDKQIYTMSTDTLSAVIDKTPSDLWSLIVNYLSVKIWISSRLPTVKQQIL